MGEVVTFAGRRNDDGPHCSGEAKCIACGHDWVAVAPVGVVHFECPSCSLMRGAFKHPIAAAEGDHVYLCACGSDNFFIRLSKHDGRTQIMCAGCGGEQSIDNVIPT